MSDILVVRDHMIESLRRELIGPDPGRPAVQWVGPGSPLNGEEILRPQDRPKMRYGAGILFPNGMTYSGLIDGASDRPDPEGSDDSVEAPEEGTEDFGGDEDDTEADDEVPVLNSFVPSSMGVSFLSDVRDGLTVHASWATYAAGPLPGWIGGRDGSEEVWFRNSAPSIGSDRTQ